MTAGWADPNYRPAEKVEAKEPRYRTGKQWKSNIEKMQRHESMIFAMALRGVDHRDIAAAFNVSRECIAKRLRPAGFLNKRGQRGRPRKAGSRSVALVQMSLFQFNTQQNVEDRHPASE